MKNYTLSKICFKCNVDLPLDAFYKHPQMKDGHLGKCKECAKIDVRANREGKIDYYRKIERERKKDPAASRKWSARNPVKRKASGMLSDAIKRGKVQKQQHCDVCLEIKPLDGHHDDYAQPLKVRWLCRICHKAWHKENGPGLNF